MALIPSFGRGRTVDRTRPQGALRVCIHRGTHQIGHAYVEIASWAEGPQS